VVDFIVIVVELGVIGVVEEEVVIVRGG